MIRGGGELGGDPSHPTDRRVLLVGQRLFCDDDEALATESLHGRITVLLTTRAW